MLKFFTTRGYTEHEMLDAVGLIHMNGRVYDAKLARFVSADPLIPDPMNTQNYNRYSYVRNQPTYYTDPSGYTEYCGSAENPCREESYVEVPWGWEPDDSEPDFEDTLEGFIYELLESQNNESFEDFIDNLADPSDLYEYTFSEVIKVHTTIIPPGTYTVTNRATSRTALKKLGFTSKEIKRFLRGGGLIRVHMTGKGVSVGGRQAAQGGEWYLVGRVVGRGSSDTFRAGSRIKITAGSEHVHFAHQSFFYKGTFRVLDDKGNVEPGAYPIYKGALSNYLPGTEKQIDHQGQVLWIFEIEKFDKTCDNCPRAALSVYEWRVGDEK